MNIKHKAVNLNESKDKIKSLIIFGIIIILLIGIYGVYNFILEGRTKEIEISQKETDVSVGQILSSKVFEQTFISQSQTVNYFTLLFATYAKENDCTVFVDLCEGKNIIQEWSFNGLELKDNTEKAFVLDTPLNDAYKKEFTIKITSNSKNEKNAVTLWYNTSDKYKNGALYLNGNDLEGDLFFRIFGDVKTSNTVLINRFLIVTGFLIILYLIIFILHFIFGKEKLPDTILKYRYLIVGVVFLYLVIFEINGFSINLWNVYFGSEVQTDVLNTLWGEQRTITSDAYGIMIPQFFSQCETGFPLYNTNISAEGANALLYGLPVWDITIIGRPSQWGFLLLGKGKGLTWYYWFRILGLLLVSYEVLMFLTKKNKHLSSIGAILIAFSPIVQWWSGHTLPEVILYGEMLFVGGYCYLNNIKSLSKKILSAVLILISAVGFVLMLYPAILVPFGIAILIMGASCVWLKRKEIRFNYTDFIIIGAAVILLALIIGRFIYISTDDLKLLTGTVSPGKRFSVGGEINIDRQFASYFQWYLPFRDIPLLNNCEASNIIPFSTIIIFVFPFIIKSDKERKFLNISLYSYFLFCNAWLLFRFPSSFAQFTLFSNVTGDRMVWTIAMLSIYMTMIAGSHLAEKRIFKRSTAIYITAGVCLIYIFCFQRTAIQSYLEQDKFLYFFISLAFLIAVAYTLMRWYKKIFITLCIMFTVAAGLTVTPLSIGTSAIYNQNFSSKIYEIKNENPDAMWLVDGYYPVSNYLLNYGINTFNATNLYPDYSKWEKIDPKGENEFYYNRYMQVSVQLAKTTEYELLSNDHLLITLSQKDLLKSGIDFVFARQQEDYDILNLIYEDTETQVWIYEVIK